MKEEKRLKAHTHIGDTKKHQNSKLFWSRRTEKVMGQDRRSVELKIRCPILGILSRGRERGGRCGRGGEYRKITNFWKKIFLEGKN